MALTIPYYSYEDIRAKADAVLAAHNPEFVVPVPVEEIIEFRYGISIIPMPGLKTVWEVDAFTGKTRKTIYIDQAVLERHSPFRYRFSLAHELGHIELHREVQDQIQFSSIEEWKAALRKMPENSRSRLEFQAYDFAGLLLVPREALKYELDQLLRVLERAKFDVKTGADAAKPFVCTRLSRFFAVSDQVIDKRLTRENFWPP